MRIRICFAKTEAGRYLSHLDLARTLERSLRRAKAPLAFSEGFNPHPKLSFASALPVGMTGCREYLDVELAYRVDAGEFCRALEGAFPPALAFVAAEEIAEGGRSLSAAVNLAVYRLVAMLPAEGPGKVAEGIAAVLAETELWRKPKTSPGKKPIPAKEVRGLLRRIKIVDADEATAGLRDAVVVEMELHLRQDGQLQPQELWEMIGVAGGFAAGAPLAVCRLDLLILRDDKPESPMHTKT